MYERLLLESGKMFKGRSVSGIGANVVDDTEPIFIPVYPEGKADIVSFVAPPMFAPFVPFHVTVTIKNTSRFTDDLFVVITNVDTGGVIDRRVVSVGAGAIVTLLPFVIILEQLTDFNGRIDAGHVVDGTDHVDDTEPIFIPVYTEGKADIVSVSVPDTFTPDVPFSIGVMITNVSAFADMLFVRITNSDTGEVLGVESFNLGAGATSLPIVFPVTLVQLTDFNGIVEAGHME